MRTLMVIWMMAAMATPALAQGMPAIPDLPSLPDFDRFMLQQPPRPARPARPARPPQVEDRIRRGEETNETVTRTVRIGGNGTLDLSNLAGDIVITGGGGNDATIRAIKRTFGGSGDDERRRRLEQVTIDVREVPNRLEVRTEYPRNARNVNVVVDYTVSVPQNAAVFLRTISGDVRATNVRGEVNIEATSGDIQVTGARRIGQLKSISGSITLNDVETDADLALNSLSGDLIAENVRARTVSFTTVSGDVLLTDTQTDRASVRAISGDITYIGQLQRNGRYEMSTQSGDITLRVAANGFTLEANTFNGDIRTDFPVTLGGGSTGDGQRRRGPARTIRGTYGDGGAVLDLRSFNGDVVVTRR